MRGIAPKGGEIQDRTRRCKGAYDQEKPGRNEATRRENVGRSNSVAAIGYDKTRIPPGKRVLQKFIGPKFEMSRVGRHFGRCQVLPAGQLLSFSRDAVAERDRHEFGHLRAAHGVRLCERSKRWHPKVKPLTPLEDSLRARLIFSGKQHLQPRRLCYAKCREMQRS